VKTHKKIRFWKWITRDIAKLTPGDLLPRWTVAVHIVLFPWETIKRQIKGSCGYQPQTDTWLIHGREYSSGFFLAVHPGQSFTVTKSEHGLIEMTEIEHTPPTEEQKNEITTN
jgi:hypothetical protein